MHWSTETQQQGRIRSKHSRWFRVPLKVPILNSKLVRNFTAKLPFEKTKANCADYSPSSFRPTSVFLLLTTSAQSSPPPSMMHMCCTTNPAHWWETYQRGQHQTGSKGLRGERTDQSLRAQGFCVWDCLIEFKWSRGQGIVSGLKQTNPNQKCVARKKPEGSIMGKNRAISQHV